MNLGFQRARCLLDTHPSFANFDCEVLIQWIKFLKIYLKRINDAGILDLRISSIWTNPQIKLKIEEDFSFGYFRLFCETYIPLKLRLVATLFLFQVLRFKIQPTGGQNSRISLNSLPHVVEPQGSGSHSYLNHFLVTTSESERSGKNISEQQPIHSKFFPCALCPIFPCAYSATPNIKLLFHLQKNLPTFKIF